MMIMVGVFQALQGLVAVFENEFYVATRNYLFQFDATTWGWIHLIVGLLVAFAGWGLLSGRTWAQARHPGWISGSSTWKRVSPGVEVKRRSPWWRWTTIRQQMPSPRPVPLPTGLVV
jgi:hypothetical protein